MKTEIKPTDGATARPWRVSLKCGDSPAICCGEEVIAWLDFWKSTDCHERKSDEEVLKHAGLIVRAVNEYDAMLAVAEVARQFSCRVCFVLDSMKGGIGKNELFWFDDKFTAALADLDSTRKPN